MKAYSKIKFCGTLNSLQGATILGCLLRFHGKFLTMYSTLEIFCLHSRAKGFRGDAQDLFPCNFTCILNSCHGKLREEPERSSQECPPCPPQQGPSAGFKSLLWREGAILSILSKSKPMSTFKEGLFLWAVLASLKGRWAWKGTVGYLTQVRLNPSICVTLGESGQFGRELWWREKGMSLPHSMSWPLLCCDSCCTAK